MAVTGCGEQRMSKQILSVSSAYNQPTVITNTKANTNTNTKTNTNTNTNTNTHVNTTTHIDSISKHCSSNNNPTAGNKKTMHYKTFQNKCLGHSWLF